MVHHMEWVFRREAAVWIDNQPVCANFYPLGTELRDWMLRKGSLRYFSPEDKALLQAPTNPYTYDVSVLAVTYASVVNESSAFAKSTEPLDSLDAETKRIRLYTENVMYTARLCEALIKQLLFCTSFREADYRKATLGSLLSKECSACRSFEEKRHKISLLGSLAHRYHLCHSYDRCLDEHIKLANRRRNAEAAHSGVTRFVPREAHVVRRQLDRQLTRVGNDLIHMLYHISEIERKMINELTPLLTAEAERLGRKVKVVIRVPTVNQSNEAG
jgi:hypothetical protein